MCIYIHKKIRRKQFKILINFLAKFYSRKRINIFNMIKVKIVRLRKAFLTKILPTTNFQHKKHNFNISTRVQFNSNKIFNNKQIKLDKETITIECGYLTNIFK